MVARLLRHRQVSGLCLHESPYGGDWVIRCAEVREKAEDGLRQIFRLLHTLGRFFGHLFQVALVVGDRAPA